MSTLAENVAKVVKAHAGLKTAISAKGVAVPEGAKLSDMPALVDRIETEWAKPRDWPDIKAMLAADTEPYEGKLFILYELLAPGVRWRIGKPMGYRYAKIVVDGVEYAEDATVAPDASMRYHVAKLYYTSKTLPSSAMEANSIPRSVVEVAETFVGIVPRWVAANGVTGKVPYAGWIYRHRPYWMAFEGLTVDKSDYPSNVACYCEYAVQKYFKVVGAGGNCRVLFQRATNIREFDIEFASPITNADNMFQTCTSLVKTPDVLDLSQCTNCTSMFAGCSSLSRVPDVLDLSRCTNCLNMFSGCLCLARVPVLDLSQCVNCSGMFRNCACLEGVSLADGSGRVATNVERMFESCTSLEALHLPDGFGQSAKDIANCFSRCEQLPSLTLPAGFGQSATSLNFCFASCSNLTSLTLPAGFGQSATSLTSCFASCVRLTSLSLPAGFGQVATTLHNCFGSCGRLTSLTLPDGFGQSATSLNDCFYHCTSLTDIIGNPNFKVSVSLADCKNLTHDSLMVVINGLQTVTSAQTLTLGTANLATLTDEEKAVATGKGWTLA